jgi:hypothetical protein
MLFPSDLDVLCQCIRYIPGDQPVLAIHYHTGILHVVSMVSRRKHLQQCPLTTFIATILHRPNVGAISNRIDVCSYYGQSDDGKKNRTLAVPMFVAASTKRSTNLSQANTRCASRCEEGMMPTVLSSGTHRESYFSAT